MQNLSPEAALAEDADEESEEDRDEVDEVVEDEPSVSVESEEVEESEVIASLGEVASAEDDGPSLQSEAIAAASDSPPTADDVVLAEEDESVEEESDAVAADPLPLVPEPESSIADLSPVASHTESVDAAESENAAVAPPSPTPAEPVEAPSAPTPDAPVRSTASPTAAPRTSSLSLHVRTAPGSNLRSSNLRLIPGLEFAPLRHEEPQRQRQIAALIDESMPEPTLPELAPNAEADPPVSDAESVPPMPAFSESGEGIVVDDVAVEVASSSAPAQIETVVDVEVEEESAVPVELPSVAPTTEEPQVALEVEDGADDVERDDPDSGHLDLDVSDSGTIYNKLDALLPELEESDLALDEPPLPEIQPLPTSRRFRITDNQYPATGNRQPAMTPLEELARKLESARIPIVEESNEPPRPVFEPSIVSDTIAEILVKQGAWAEAMKAFQMLARMKPARHAHYQERIREMRERIAAEAGPPLPDHFSTDG